MPEVIINMEMYTMKKYMETYSRLLFMLLINPNNHQGPGIDSPNQFAFLFCLGSALFATPVAFC